MPVGRALTALTMAQNATQDATMPKIGLRVMTGCRCGVGSRWLRMSEEAKSSRRVWVVAVGGCWGRCWFDCGLGNKPSAGHLIAPAILHA